MDDVLIKYKELLNQKIIKPVVHNAKIFVL